MTPVVNQPEIWTLVNDDEDWWHPIHIHLDNMRVLTRNGGAPFADEVDGVAKRDTIPLGPGDRVEVFLNFRDFTGPFVFHCHNLEHEDLAMMARFDVLSQPPRCGDGSVNQPDEECDGGSAAGCPGRCRSDCTCAPAATTSTSTTAVATSTTRSSTTAAPPTTTTTQPSGSVTLFCDDFGSGLGNWTESGEGDWNTESLHSTSGHPSTGSGSPAAHSDECGTTCTITMASPVNLSGRTAATLKLLRFLDSELDSGEYLWLQVWNGSTWQTLADWSADNGSDTNQWHAHTFDLSAYLGRPDFRVRFVTKESNTSEHVHVDDVCITATSGATTPTTTTVAPPTSTTTLAPQTIVASVVADVRTEASNASSNFGTSSTLAADADSAKNTFIRLTVSGIGGRTVTSSRLRLTVNSNGSNSGGQMRRIAACDWSETAVTFNNQPSLTPVGSIGPALGAVSPGQTVFFDLPGLTVDGTYCYAITSPSSDSVEYSSREAGSGRPEVLLTLGP